MFNEQFVREANKYNLGISAVTEQIRNAVLPATKIMQDIAAEQTRRNELVRSSFAPLIESIERRNEATRKVFADAAEAQRKRDEITRQAFASYESPQTRNLRQLVAIQNAIAEAENARVERDLLQIQLLQEGLRRSDEQLELLRRQAKAVQTGSLVTGALGVVAFAGLAPWLFPGVNPVWVLLWCVLVYLLIFTVGHTINWVRGRKPAGVEVGDDALLVGSGSVGVRGTASNSRWATPGQLARHLGPKTVQTPALDLIGACHGTDTRPGTCCARH